MEIATATSPTMPSAGDSPVKCFFAACLSAVLPGAGQLLRRKARAAAVSFVATLSVASALAWLGAWKLPEGMTAAILALFVVVFVASIHSGWAKPTEKRLTYWSLLLLGPLAFLSSARGFQLIARPAGFGVFSIPTSSMEPTVRQGERVIADMRYYRRHSLKRGDVVVLRRDDFLTIKRIIAVPGDAIEGRSGEIYVNGAVLVEPYVEHIGKPFPWMTDFKQTLGSTNYFAMGDNRDYSLDSRSPDFAPVTIDDIRGRVLFIAAGLRSPRNGTMVK